MARAYQDAHIIDNLTSGIKSLQVQTAELSKAKGLHEERITNLQKQNADQGQKISALETRMSANQHNTTARLLNAHAYHTRSLHAPLTPLHDLSTNSPIRQFPKHERDIRTMSGVQVVQVLQALDVKTLGLSAGQKKGELRAQVGLPREGDVGGGKGEGNAAAVAGAVVGKTEEGKGEGGGGGKAEGKRPLPKVAPGSTAEKAGRTGMAAAKGVSKPVGTADEKKN